MSCLLKLKNLIKKRNLIFSVCTIGDKFRFVFDPLIKHYKFKYTKDFMEMKLCLNLFHISNEKFLLSAYLAHFINDFCMPESFNTNISHQLFDYKITFVMQFTTREHKFKG